MPAGRPKLADPGTLYAFAHQFYWDFRRIDKGIQRRREDKARYELLLAEIETTPVERTAEDQERLLRLVDEEISQGLIPRSERFRRLADMECAELEVVNHMRRMEAANDAVKVLRVPGESDVIDELLAANSVKKIRQICKDAYTTREIPTADGGTKKVPWPNWPISPGSPLPRYLSEHAMQFIKATHDRRFPRSDRPTSRHKQLWFVSLALAGALYGVSVRTTINLVGSKTPEELFAASRSGKTRRKQRKK